MSLSTVTPRKTEAESFEMSGSFVSNFFCLDSDGYTKVSV